MKKLIMTIVLVMAIMTAKTQITITSSDMPKSGKADIVGNDTVTKNLNIGTASSNAQTWDFSSLKKSYSKLAIYSSTSPYQQNAADFPGANLYTWGPSILFTSFYGGAPVYTNNYGYMYWKTDVSGFHIVGFRGDCGPKYGYMNVLEGPQELLMGTPATYGNQFPDSARWVIKYDKNPLDRDTIYKSIVNKTLTVDAFGTLKSPLDSSSTLNVIRVHEHVIEVDSIEVKVDTTYMGYPVNLTIPYYQIHKIYNNYQFWANGLNYPMAIVHADSANKIISTEFLTDTIPCYAITGNVFNNTGSQKVTKGTANLVVKDSWNHLFNWLETVNIDNNGHFQFADVAGGNFLVQANPDTVQYPYLEPTYFGDTTYWQNATPITMLSDTNISIHCRNDSLLAVMTGAGSISGTIWMDTTQVGIRNPTHTAPARGVKVVLVQNPGGACHRVVHTDNNGNFNFSNLPSADYKLIVDIPGLFMDSTYYISISKKSLDYPGLSFFYDSTIVHRYYNVGIVDHNINSNYDVTVYPNPFSDNATVYISNPDNDNRLITLTIFDVVGKKVKEINAENTDRVGISSEGLTKGLYIYELRVNREIVSSGKIIVN